jgi:ornithine cyclodeaminase/alanine dehydrogenase-like protein (mu-crystallin family)
MLCFGSARRKHIAALRDFAMNSLSRIMKEFSMLLIDKHEVKRRLTYDRCISLVREAMIAFSSGQTHQLLRSILSVGQGHVFGVMPGGLGDAQPFGAKLVSVYPENFYFGRPSHQGVVVLFDPETGAPVCVADAGEITAIRTAAASAVATDALARADAQRLTVLGYGEQAVAHIKAILHVRPLSEVRVWGRSPERARAFAKRMTDEIGQTVGASGSVEEAIAGADIVCAVTAAQEPILESPWVAGGTHINLVGSSFAGPAEADNALVARARFIVDSREAVLTQGAEFLRAKAAGLINYDHIVGEIGEVLAGAVEGRQSSEQVTIYKSLGHVVQDMAAAVALWRDSDSD